MRIGFDAKRIFNNNTGLGNYGRSLLTSLQEQFPENEYILYTPKIKKTFEGWFRNGITRIILPEKRIYSYFSSLWRSRNLTKLASKHRLDVYHGLSNELPLGIEKTGIKTLVTIHDLIFIRHPEMFPFIDRFFYKQKFKSACRRADIIVATSAQTKNDIVHFYKISEEKIQVIYQDCHPIFQTPWKKDRLDEIKKKYQLPDRFILCVSAQEPRKNQLNLVKAFEIICAETDLNLVLVGKEGPLTDPIKGFLAEKEITDRVQLIPFVPFEDLPGIYRNAEIFAYPSLFEGFGIPLIEAMRCGLPIFSSLGSCFREVAGDAGVYADPQRPEKMAQTLLKLIKDDQMRQKMLQAAEIQKLLFDSTKLSEQMNSLYRSV